MYKRGEENHNAKLTEADVTEIKQMLALKLRLQHAIREYEDSIRIHKKGIRELSITAIAKKKGLCIGTVSRIKNGETWAHIE